MSAGAFDRRAFVAACGAAVLAAPSRASVTQHLVFGAYASRLPPSPAHNGYVPPTDLKTIRDIYSRMTAAVMINGQGPYQFVVDTGANQSAIAAELAAQLSLEDGGRRPVNGVAGVQITPTALANLKVGARPAADAVLSVLTQAAIGGQGMLGLDQLDGGRVTLDFQNQSLSITPGRGGGALDDEVAVRAQLRDGQLTLVDADVGGIKVTAFLDSGAQDTIGNMALRRLALTRYPAIPWRQTPIISVTGQTMAAEMADLPALRIGGMHVPSWPVAFADLHTFQMWGLVDQPSILIGVDILSRFESVCLDFARDEVRFRLPPHG